MLLVLVKTMLNLVNEIVMPFNAEISIDDIISIISVALVIIGGFFSLSQWCKNTKLKRAEYINELTEKIRTDKAITKIVYMLEYDKPWYTEEFHRGGKLEQDVDKTLSYFSYVCYLKKKRLIGRNEFEFFKYRIKRIFDNAQIQDYLYNLYHYANNQSKGDGKISFQYLLDYGRKNKMICDDFYNPKAYKVKKDGRQKYHRYLNFDRPLTLKKKINGL